MKKRNLIFSIIFSILAFGPTSGAFAFGPALLGAAGIPIFGGMMSGGASAAKSLLKDAGTTIGLIKLFLLLASVLSVLLILGFIARSIFRSIAKKRIMGVVSTLSRLNTEIVLEKNSVKKRSKSKKTLISKLLKLSKCKKFLKYLDKDIAKKYLDSLRAIKLGKVSRNNQGAILDHWQQKFDLLLR
jgi:hypothetical protein